MASPEYLERYFIAYDVDRTSDFPVCGEGLIEEGTCPEPIWDESNCDDDDVQSDDEAGTSAASEDGPAGRHDSPNRAHGSGSAGCSTAASTAAGAGWMLGLVGLLGGAVRRRS